MGDEDVAQRKTRKRRENLAFVATLAGFLALVCLRHYESTSEYWHYGGTLALINLSFIVLLICGCASLGYYTFLSGACGNRAAGIVGAAIGIFMAVFIAGMFLPALGAAHEPARRISCQSNIKQIGMALQQYAARCNGFLPPGDAVEAFSNLRTSNYLTDPKIFVCPTTGTCPCQSNAPLTEETVSYIYFGAGRNISEVKPEELLVIDKTGNHSNYGNVLFGDWNTKGFKGEERTRLIGKEHIDE